MLPRLTPALALAVLLASPALAQTIRFDTNVGHFDMVLNPTGNINLQGHVDNILAYVESGRYDLSVINRAVDGNNADPSDDFVLQMGGFQASFLNAPPTFASFPPIETFDPVIVDTDGDGTVDFDFADLDNVRSTVSLALSNSPNSGTSSFFVNLGDNSGADPARTDLDSSNFIPFAEIANMATIDLILSLNQANLSDGGLAADDIPILNNNRLVIVERAFVIDPDPVMAALAASLEATTEPDNLSEQLLAVEETTGGGDLPPVIQPVIEDPVSPQAAQGEAVPEPPVLVLAAGAFMVLVILKRPHA